MNICIFCASSDEVPMKYREAVAALGTEIGKLGHTLVFGGYDTGLMGEAARSVRAAGGTVVGVVPDDVNSFMTRDVFESDATHAVSNITQRMRLMCDLADAFVVAPGAFGTLEELFVALVEQKIASGEKKPIVLYNVDGFYDWFDELCQKTVNEGLMTSADRALFTIEANPAALMNCLRDGR